MLYRAAKDEGGNFYIAYHYVWENEINNSKGLMPMINRNLYTGGLALQKMMFGKEDVEVVLIKVDKNGHITEVNYETAKDYNPKDFSVKHENVKIDKPINTPIYFNVISWNHLFDYVDKYDKEKLSNYKVINLKPKYFSNKEWDDYEIFKEKETRISKNRAHYKFERIGIE